MDEFRSQFNGLLNSVNPNTNTLAGPGGGGEGGGSGNLGDVVIDNSGFFGSLSGANGQEPADIYFSYDFGLFKLNNVKVVDFSSLKQVVEFFRPIINGFILVLMGFYWYKEFLSFIGQAHNMASAKSKAEEGD